MYTFDRDGIINQITTFAARHAAALDAILGAPDEALPEQVRTAAEGIFENLQQGDPLTAVLVRELFFGAPSVVAHHVNQTDPEWWSTPLGIASYAIADYGWPGVPRKFAVAILGVTRQRVSQLEHAGVLEALSETSLTAASVRARWESHGPLSGRLDEEKQEA